MTIIEAINNATNLFAAAGISHARLDAEVILSHLLEKDRAWIITHGNERLVDKLRIIFEFAVSRRTKREPLQYITGKQEFWGLGFIVSPDVLIPRPETEFVVEAAIRAAKNRTAPLIIDLGTGSGCITVSLAKEIPAARFLATDQSAKALGMAKENARRHTVSDRVRFFQGDLLVPLEGLDIWNQVDIIVSNPPYVRSEEVNTLQSEVRDYEPEMALIAGPEGTEVHERIISAAPRFLKEHGVLIMEMGMGQSEALSWMIEAAGIYDKPEIQKDLAGIERVIIARKK